MCDYVMLNLLTVFLVTAVSAAGITGGECDWTGSGLSTGGGRGVTPVYLRCRAGHLTWVYPRGALRVVLRLPHDERDVRVCVRVHRGAPDADPDGDADADIFLGDDILDFREITKEDDAPHKKSKEEENPAFPARLFLEGTRSLIPLYSHDDGDKRLVRCFRGKKGQAAIYIEAIDDGDTSGLRRRVAALQYEVQPMNAASDYDPSSSDCRPCTNHEMSLAFCTNDLVARGIMIGLTDRPELDSSQLTLKLTKLIRHTTKDGRVYQQEASSPLNASADLRLVDELYDDEAFDVYNYRLIEGRPTKKSQRQRDRRRRGRGPQRHDRSGRSRTAAAERSLYAWVHAGARCGVAAGEGEFMFMARRRLGRLSLVCAPRIDQWAELLARMNRDGSAHCLLTS